MSPSRSRRRPWIRSPFTNEPFVESPSSTSVASSRTNSTWAWSAETSLSPSRRRSADGLRPIQSSVGALLDADDPLLVGRVAVDEERAPVALGDDLVLQLLRALRCAAPGLAHRSS